LQKRKLLTEKKIKKKQQFLYTMNLKHFSYKEKRYQKKRREKNKLGE